MEDLIFFSSFPLNFLLLGRSYWGTDTQNHPSDTGQSCSDCCKMHLPEAAPHSLAWSHCPQHLGFNRHPNTHLFPCLRSSFAFSVLPTKWLSVFSPAGYSVSFHRYLYFHFKRKNFNYSKPTFSHPEAKPTASTQWNYIAFATSFPLFINLNCTALKNNTLKSTLLKEGMNKSQTCIRTSL